MTGKDLLLLVLGAVLGIGSSLFANFLSGPLLSGITSHRVIQFLAKTPGTSIAGFDGGWEIAWQADSERFSSSSAGPVTIASFASWIAFQAAFELNGELIDYRFVGRNRGGKISGYWFDRRSYEGYHGQYQVVRSGDLRSAAGAWLGFSSARGVRFGIMTWERAVSLV
jgi:hypothetical protein